MGEPLGFSINNKSSEDNSIRPASVASAFIFPAAIWTQSRPGAEECGQLVSSPKGAASGPSGVAHLTALQLLPPNTPYGVCFPASVRKGRGRRPSQASCPSASDRVRPSFTIKLP